MTDAPSIVAEDCGTCAGCKLRAQVLEVLEHVDRTMAPPYARALEELERAVRYGNDREMLRALSRSAHARKREWMLARERVMTPEVCRWIMCVKRSVTILVGGAPRRPR